MTRSTTAVLAGIIATLASVLGSCSDSSSTGPKESVVADSGVVVSDAIRTTLPALRDVGLGVLASRAVIAAAEDVDVAYVSIPPGEVDDGVSAVITSPRMTGTVTVSLSGGGFDPVPLIASQGDIVEIEVRRLGGRPPTRFTRAVPESRRPKVVRTVPPRGKVDVVVNADIMIVFTEPVDEGTLSTSSIRLMRGNTPVPGTVRLLDGVTAGVVFQPATPLDANVDYALVITEAVRDLAGDALANEVSVPFTTGSGQVGTVTRLAVFPDTIQILAGSAVQLTVEARDSLGRVVTGRAITWVSENPAVAAVSATGLATAFAAGEVRITATVQAGTGFSAVRVVTSAAPVASVEVLAPTPTTVVDGKVHVEAIARDATGNVVRFRAISWSSSDPTIAAVAAAPGGRAVVTALATGTVTITATIEGRSDGAPISVVTPGYPYTRISAGENMTCGLTSASWAMCWGWNGIGQLGNGTNHYISGSALVPRPVVGGLRFSSIAAGGTHVCALTPAGAAYCWGYNGAGQLAAPSVGPERCGPDAGAPCSMWPAAVSADLRFASIAVGSLSYHQGRSCGLTAAGVAYCWGSNFGGQLGIGTTTGPQQCSGLPCSPSPMAIGGALRFNSIGIGGGHSCALSTTGAAYCWGVNDQGQLGNGTVVDRSAPAAVAGGRTFTALSVGEFHNCGLTSDGTAYCWGENRDGQLGTGVISDSSAVPVPVAGGLRFTMISAGWAHTCGITTGGATYCWGANFGLQLGTGIANSLPRPSPSLVAGGLSFATVTAGFDHSCGLTTDGVAYCWGENDGYQLGLPDQETRLVPTKVSGQP